MTAVTSFSNFDRLRLKRVNASLGKTLKAVGSFGQIYNKEVIRKKVGEFICKFNRYSLF